MSKYNNEKAKKVYEWYEDIRSQTMDWRVGRDRCIKSYFGNQWETGVADKIRDRGQVDVVINILRPLLRNRVSTMISKKPTGKIYGVQKEDIVLAQLLEEFMDWHWYNSSGQIRAERVTMSQQREGVGYFVVMPDFKADYGRGELKIYDTTYRHVWIPKYAGKEWDFADSPYIILSNLKTKEQFYMESRIKRNLDESYFTCDDEIRWTGQREHEEKDEVGGLPEGMIDQEFIREFDTFEKFYKDVRILRDKATGNSFIIDDDYSLNDIENQSIKDGTTQELVAPVPRIKWTKTYGEKVFDYQEILPIDKYPVVAVIDEDTGNALSLGEIDQNFGVQELLNKFFSIVVHNAALASNPRTYIDAARSAVTDMQKFREDRAAPGAILDVKFDPATGKPFIYEEKPDALNPAFYPLFERLVQQVQFGMATFGGKLGDTSTAPDTYSATLQYGEWQQDNLRIPLSRLEMGIQRVFDILLMWAPKFYDFPKPFPFVNDLDEIEMKGVNINDATDITKIRAKFRIRMGSTMPASSVAYMNIFKELAAINPIFMKYLIDYLPIKEKTKIAKELDLVAQLNQQVQEKDTELNTVAGMLQNALRQQSEAEIRRDTEQASIALDKIIAEQQIITKEMKSEQKMQTKRLAQANKEKNKKVDKST